MAASIGSFGDVLQAENLTDLSQFCTSAFCDEVPLYSRYSQLSFMDQLSLEDRNASLLASAIDFLQRLIRQSKSTLPFFAAITIWQDEDSDPIVPNVFVCNQEPVKSLESLKLHEPATPFSVSIGRLLSKAIPAGDYRLLEDVETLPDSVRVFVGPKTPPYGAFVTLDAFQRS